MFGEILSLMGPGGDPVLNAIALAFLWMAGAVVASFSGLVADRIGGVEEGGSVLAALSSPPSRCDGCGRRIPAVNLVPVFGWLACRGKCGCGAKVPARYPLTEALAGTATAAIPLLADGAGPWTAAGIFLLWAGLLVSWVDVKEHIVPEELTWAMLFAGLLASPYEPDVFVRVAGAATCCAAMWLSLACVGWMKGIDARAGGDVALAAAAGAWIGMQGTVCFLLASSLSFVAYAGPLRLRGVEWVPMGPALCFGLVVTFLAGSWG